MKISPIDRMYVWNTLLSLVKNASITIPAMYLVFRNDSGCGKAWHKPPNLYQALIVCFKIRFLWHEMFSLQKTCLPVTTRGIHSGTLEYSIKSYFAYHYLKVSRADSWEIEKQFFKLQNRSMRMDRKASDLCNGYLCRVMNSCPRQNHRMILFSKHYMVSELLQPQRFLQRR